MVDLRLYPNVESSENVSMGKFHSLPEAWEEAYRLTTITRYELKDFFTCEDANEANHRI